MMSGIELNRIHSFMLENNLKNESEAIGMIVQMNSRYQTIISALEKKAHEAQEWKERAEKEVGNTLNPIIAGDAKSDTDLKQKSVENIKDIREQDVQLSKEQKAMSKRVAKKIIKKMEVKT